MNTISPETSAALGGPAWLAGQRAAAAERFDAATLPTAEEEIWRYSRIGEFDLDDYVLASAAGDVPRHVHDLIDGLGAYAALVVSSNGYVVSIDVDETLANKGLFVGRAEDVDDAPPAQATEHGKTADVFADLNDAYAPEPLLVTCPRGVEIEMPIIVVHWADAEGVLSLPRLQIHTADGSSISVVELYLSAPVACVQLPVTELDAASGSRLSYLAIQDLDPATWQIAYQQSRVGQQATLTSGGAALGGSYARLRTDCRLVGRGATGNLVTAYVGDGDQTLDFRTYQDHEAQDCTSDLLFKGAVDDNSRSIYTGLIKVRPEARGTNAFQTNRNLKLSDHAWAESVPNLEIENNDVKCSHASTVGPVDEEQTFYLESRGVPPQVAQRLLLRGFFAEVVGRLPVPAAAPYIEGRIAEKLAEGDTDS